MKSLHKRNRKANTLIWGNDFVHTGFIYKLIEKDNAFLSFPISFHFSFSPLTSQLTHNFEAGLALPTLVISLYSNLCKISLM